MTQAVLSYTRRMKSKPQRYERKPERVHLKYSVRATDFKRPYTQKHMDHCAETINYHLENMGFDLLSSDDYQYEWLMPTDWKVFLSGKFIRVFAPDGTEVFHITIPNQSHRFWFWFNFTTPFYKSLSPAFSALIAAVITIASIAIVVFIVLARMDLVS
jgi:hypothetical protein